MFPPLPDKQCAARMPAAGKAMNHLFPGRAFMVIVFPGNPAQGAHHISNCPREDVQTALKQILDTGLKELPSREPTPPSPS